MIRDQTIVLKEKVDERVGGIPLDYYFYEG